MSARKVTVDEEGNKVIFSTKRGKPSMCSDTCGGVYRFQGERYCKYFNSIVGKRHKKCIANEVKGV